jgi:hypothetical protein
MGVVTHHLIGAKAHARQASHAQLLLYADDTPLVLRQCPCGADGDTLTALNAKRSAEIAMAVVVDAYARLGLVNGLEPGL